MYEKTGRCRLIIIKVINYDSHTEKTILWVLSIFWVYHSNIRKKLI